MSSNEVVPTITVRKILSELKEHGVEVIVFQVGTRDPISLDANPFR